MEHCLTSTGTPTRAEKVLENTFNESEPIEYFCELKSGDWVIIQLGSLKLGYHYRSGVVSERKDGSIEVSQEGIVFYSNRVANTEYEDAS